MYSDRNLVSLLTHNSVSGIIFMDFRFKFKILDIIFQISSSNSNLNLNLNFKFKFKFKSKFQVLNFLCNCFNFMLVSRS